MILLNKCTLNSPTYQKETLKYFIYRTEKNWNNKNNKEHRTFNQYL